MSANEKPERATKHERTVLIFTLLNPMHDEARCICALLGLLQKALFHKETQDDAHQGPILRAAMKFLGTKRSKQEHAALRVLDLVISDICATIADYFLELGPGKFRKAKINTSPAMQRWPVSSDDVIPSGNERDVLDALVRWVEIVPNGVSIFTLIGSLARYWEPFAKEVFSFGPVFMLAVQHLEGALESYDPNAPLGDHYVSVAFPVSVCGAFFITLCQVDLSLTLTKVDASSERVRSLAVHMDAIIKDMPEMADAHRWFTHVLGCRPRINVEKGIRAEKTPSQHYHAAFHEMMEARNRNQCLNVGCVAKLGVRLRVCSRCNIVRYCSSQCQTAAWNAGYLPHKTLCNHIVAFRATVGLVEQQDWDAVIVDGTTRHRSPFELAALCDPMTVDARIAEAIWRNINSLKDFVWAARPS
ncbi:hypothetical protein DFH06DRAFT_1131756 [Mycena polygramma]|nr:hypothetical protein DFH06DRAFT_1131756 [Mycena polygramma]